MPPRPKNPRKKNYPGIRTGACTEIHRTTPPLKRDSRRPRIQRTPHRHQTYPPRWMRLSPNTPDAKGGANHAFSVNFQWYSGQKEPKSTQNSSFLSKISTTDNHFWPVSAANKWRRYPGIETIFWKPYRRGRRGHGFLFKKQRLNTQHTPMKTGCYHLCLLLKTNSSRTKTPPKNIIFQN